MWKAAPGALVVALALMLAGAGQASAQEPLWLNYGCMPSPSDCTGWYRAPVRLSWDWDDLTVDPSGGNCSTQQLSSDTRGLNVACEVTDGTDTLRRQLTIHIDQTAPSVLAAPARPPDYNGWFNHPVSVAFNGSDATSGLQSCTSASYGGPDAAGVVLNGSCQDVAGNVRGASFALSYDSTDPAAPDVTARPNNNRVTLRWAPPADAEANRDRARNRHRPSRPPLPRRRHLLHGPRAQERQAAALPHHLDRPRRQSRCRSRQRRPDQVASPEPRRRCPPRAAAATDLGGPQARHLLQRPALPGDRTRC